MRLAVRRLLPVLRMRNGEQHWIELRETRLPEGGRKFKIGLTSVYTVMGLLCFGGYAYAKAYFNPDSEWARIGDRISRWSMGASEEAVKEMEKEDPNPYRRPFM